MAAEESVRLATAIGAAWAAELVRVFVASEREILGAWPGTISEARMRVLAGFGRTLEIDVLDDLARVATVAARREWQHSAQPDPER